MHTVGVDAKLVVTMIVIGAGMAGSWALVQSNVAAQAQEIVVVKDEVEENAEAIDDLEDKVNDNGDALKAQAEGLNWIGSAVQAIAEKQDVRLPPRPIVTQ